MAEIFYDNGSLFLIVGDGGLPESPYWNSFLRIGATAGSVDGDGNGNWVFCDEDGEVIALQMLDPVTDTGVPKESVLHWLRQNMDESEIVSFLDMMKECKEQMAGSEA